MKKYIAGSWTVLKNYLFIMLFFYLFYVGFYKKADLFSIALFIVMEMLIYYELVHYVSKDNRVFGKTSPLNGLLYGLAAVIPFVIIQIIVTNINIDLSAYKIDFNRLRVSLAKGFMAPMLFIIHKGHNSLLSYAIGWGSIVLASFLGYFAGYKHFDLNLHIRKLFGLQPKANNKQKR
jgi:hypothetical protein